LEGVPFPKSKYASAGSLHPVQTYLYIKPNRVEHFGGGTYYYHPMDHRLVLLSTDAKIERSHYQPRNRMVFDSAAFSVFFIGQMKAITPVYGAWSRDFCLIEAGLMIQLLELAAPKCHIGLAHVGGFDFEPVRQWFALDEDHVYLHSLLGGSIEIKHSHLQTLVEDAQELRTLLKLVEDRPESSHSETPLAMSGGSRPAFEKSAADLIEALSGFLREKLPDNRLPVSIVLLNLLQFTADDGRIDNP